MSTNQPKGQTQVTVPGRKLTVTILSLSLLTVMAGAAVAPALDVIKQYFNDVDQTLVQLIISMPALFIAITNIIFPKLAARIKSRTLLIAGLLLYIIGGCGAAVWNSIWMVLLFRALVGCGVGIIMPLSTGLLAYYYPKDQQDRLMGYSSAMNQMGGVTATLASGFLAAISWRASFMVYLIGLLCLVLCLLFLPNEMIGGKNAAKVPNAAPATTGRKSSEAESGHKNKSVFGQYYSFIIAMFLLMFTFFVYPSSFAIETASEGIIPAAAVTVIMASLDFIAFFGGLLFAGIKSKVGAFTKYMAPLMFVIGYGMLFFVGGWPGALLSALFIGFANGMGVPLIISTAARTAGKEAATTVLPLVSMALYASQFIVPFILSAASKIAPGVEHLPYLVAFISGLILLFWSSTIKEPEGR